MSTINTNVYPQGSSGFHGMTICANHLGMYVDDPWESSIAVSQSTDINAPFNNIDFIAAPVSLGGDPIVAHLQRDLQKIGLVYIGTGTNFGNLNQFYNGSVDGVLIGQSNGCYYSYATLRKTARTNFVQSCQTHYRADQYSIITGLQIKSCLGVLCVGFRDNSFCSFKYYNEHKDTISQKPSCIFMQVFYGNSEDSNARRNIAPIDLMELNYKYWVYDNNIVTPSTTDIYQLFPWSVLSNLTCINAGTEPLKTPLINPSIIFPVVSCMQGNVFDVRAWSISPPYQRTQGTAILGGGLNDMYTLERVGDVIYTIPTQKAFDNCMKIAAMYGLPFTIDFPTTPNDLYNADIITFMPISNEGGYFTGAYEVLTNNNVVSSDLSESNMRLWSGDVNTIYNNRIYDPDIPVSTPSIDLTEPTLTAIDAFNRSYIINRSDVDEFGRILWSADDSILQKIKKAWELFGEKPINGIINLILFPFDVRSKTGAATIENITIGQYDSGILAYRIPQTAKAVYDFGSFKWNFNFNGSFLDYAPYTEAELYIPFFGVMPISNEHFIGKTIDIKIVVDFITGAATCIIYVVDGQYKHPVIYKNATIGIQVPVSGDYVNQRITAMLDNSLQVVDTVGKGIDAIAGKDISKAVDAAGQVINPQFTPSTMYQTAGSSTPECSLYLPKKPYLILYTPELMDVSNYGHLIGNATEQDVTISDCTGFNVFTNIDMTGVTATQEEKELIRSLLEKGVYL